MAENVAWGRWSDDLCRMLIKKIPELDGAYQREMRHRSHQTIPTLDTFENMLRGYITDMETSEKDPHKLGTVLDLLESMCSNDDVRVQDVAAAAFLRRAEWDENWLELISPHLGSKSRQALRNLIRTHNQWNQRVNAKLFEVFPDLQDAYVREFKSRRDEEPGPHTVYGELLLPLIRNLLESRDQPHMLKKAFNLLEAMCGDKDVKVQEVAAVTVLEGLEWNPEWRELMKPYLVLHQTNNAGSVAAGRFRARRVAQGIPRRISKRRNAARGLPAATRRARPQAPICRVAALGNIPDIPCGPRLASGRSWVR